LPFAATVPAAVLGAGRFGISPVPSGISVRPTVISSSEFLRARLGGRLAAAPYLRGPVKPPVVSSTAAWRAIGSDPEGLDLALDTPAGTLVRRIAYPEPIRHTGPLRAVLKKLADTARSG